MKKLISFALILFSTTSYAEYTPWAIPTNVALVGSQGFRVVASFGVPYNCEVPNQVFVSINHPQYKEIYSMVLAAYASQSKIKFEVRKCGIIGWLSSSPIAILDSSAAGDAQISK